MLLLLQTVEIFIFDSIQLHHNHHRFHHHFRRLHPVEQLRVLMLLVVVQVLQHHLFNNNYSKLVYRMHQLPLLDQNHPVVNHLVILFNIQKPLINKLISLMLQVRKLLQVLVVVNHIKDRKLLVDKNNYHNALRIN